MSPRRESTRKQDSEAKTSGQSIGQLVDWIQRATWSKVLTIAAAIVVSLWGYFGLEDGIDKNDRRLDQQSVRITELEGVDERVREVLETQEDIEDSQRELGRFVSSAVAEGVAQGIAEGLASAEDRIVRRVSRIVEKRLRE